jgi:nucleoside-diphosphate-sugar epimerase
VGSSSLQFPKFGSFDAKTRDVTTILTGASGFIGAGVAKVLQARGDDVVVIGRTPIKGLGFRPLDLLHDDPRPLLHALAPSRLVHLAWNPDRATLWNGVENLAWVAATLKLVLAFQEVGGVRAVVAGSSAEYDWSYELLDELATPLRPHSGYGIAKRAIYEMLSNTPALAPLSIGWARIFFPFGPHDKPDRLLSQVVDGVAAGLPVALSSGRQVRPFIHVDDAAAALVGLLDSAVEGPVNIALDETISVRDLTLIAAAQAGDAALLRFGDRPLQAGEPQVMRAAVTRLTNEVGFRPKYSIREGVVAAVAARRGRMAGEASYEQVR